MYEFCVDLNGNAREAVERVNRRMVCANASKSKVQGEKESVEEFIRRVECISAGCPNSQALAFVSGEEVGAVGETWANGDSTMAGLEGFGEFDMVDG